MSRFSLIVLAAGASRRLGRAKQLLPFQNKPLLQHVLHQTRILDWNNQVLVLGAGAEIILPALDIGGFEPALNPDWETGMASSVRVGVEQTLARCPDTENLLFLVCDQPFVSAGLLRDLRALHMQSGKKITACRYQDTLGVPAIFSKSVFPELLGLQGDRGAAGVIRKHAGDCAEMPFEHGAVDVDTEADYRQLGDWTG
ncbi:MAG: nucleotidyltransferase family protein [Saprospiraceae bacterium]